MQRAPMTAHVVAGSPAVLSLCRAWAFGADMQHMAFSSDSRDRPAQPAEAAGTGEAPRAAAGPLLQDVLRRLEVLERQMGPRPAASTAPHVTDQQRPHGAQQQRHGRTAHQQQGGLGSSNTRERRHPEPSDAAGVAEEAGEAAEDAMKELHPKIAKFLSSGYLESQAQLREQLMEHEWEGTVRPWMRRRGVAEFERYAAEHEVAAPFDAVTRLYQDPDDLGALHDERSRQLARAIIAGVEADKKLEVYKACSETAKGLANVVDTSQSTGLAALWAAVRRLLPIPGLR